MKDKSKALIKRLMEADDYDGQVVFQKEFPARKARYSSLKPSLPPPITTNLKTIGISKLYSHQVEAVKLVRGGSDVVIVTETASGKSLCYNLPVLEAFLSDASARALYLFPTKALGQDQTRMLHQLIDPSAKYLEGRCLYAPQLGREKISFGAYDGDTPRDARPRIRREARALLTNPDMLSLGILPNHSRLWSRFFSNLKFVVIDEIHTYSGVFGSHLGNLIRRLDRICKYYGASPQYICCSATIANPAEHAGALVGRRITAITKSGAPSPGRSFLLWNPPLCEDKTGGFTRSPLSETIKLFSFFITRKKRTIVFARAKPTVEVILKYTRDNMIGGPVKPEKIISYRAGYLASDRRAIERALSDGELLGVTCTTALELGVDIGSLEVAVMNGFPGSIASVFQQAGRAGRRGTKAIAIFVAYHEPLDQYFMRHPEYFFGRPVERAIVNPDNPYILKPHLAAAAAELPLNKSEKPRFGRNYIKLVREMIVAGDLRERRGGAYWTGESFPAARVNLRSASPSRYAIMTPDGSTIGEMDAAGASHYLHDGAVYLHLGRTYLVEKLDFKNKIAHVKTQPVDYYTRSLSGEDISVDETLREKKTGSAKVHFGYVNVTSRVHSFKKIRRRDDAMIGIEELDFPEEKLWTQSFWLTFGNPVIRKIQREGRDVKGGLHAVEHAAIAIMPFLVTCDRNDIGGVSTERHPDTDDRAAIFVHDGFEGGIGLSESAYDRIDELMAKTLELIEECPCDHGCPSCIQSPKCGNMNEPLDKQAAMIILQDILKKA